MGDLTPYDQGFADGFEGVDNSHLYSGEDLDCYQLGLKDNSLPEWYLLADDNE